MPIVEIEADWCNELSQPWILVTVATQTLSLITHGQIHQTYSISTSAFGLGCQQDSHKTPTGAHRIKRKIGHAAALGEIFEGRMPLGRCAPIVSLPVQAKQDLILTRIMWLEGLEIGINSGEGVDSYARYIYIHGTQDEGLLGQAASHGCVRMSNTAVVELFDLVNEGTFVYIGH